MTSRGKVDDGAKKRIAELAKQGKSHRQIAAVLEDEGLKLSHRAVGAVLEKLRAAAEQAKERAKPRKGAGPVRGTRRVREGGWDEDGAEDGEEEGEGGAPVTPARPLPPLPEGAGAVARILHDRARVASEMAETLRVKMMTDPRVASAWAKADHQARMWIEALVAEMPPPPPDPSKDPNNIGARQAVHARVLQAIEAQEARLGALCPRCFKEVAGR